MDKAKQAWQAWQANFIKVLAETVVYEMTQSIQAGQVPETWDGIELRWWLADRFDLAVLHSTGTRQRKAAYKKVAKEQNL